MQAISSSRSNVCFVGQQVERKCRTSSSRRKQPASHRWHTLISHAADAPETNNNISVWFECQEKVLVITHTSCLLASDPAQKDEHRRVNRNRVAAGICAGIRRGRSRPDIEESSRLEIPRVLVRFRWPNRTRLRCRIHSGALQLVSGVCENLRGRARFWEDVRWSLRKLHSGRTRSHTLRRRSEKDHEMPDPKQVRFHSIHTAKSPPLL